MDREPARAGASVRSDRCGTSAGRKTQSPGLSSTGSPSHRQRGAAREDDDPLVLLLQVLRGLVARPAEDLLDDEVAVREQLQEELLARRRSCARIVQSSSSYCH